MRSQRTSEPVAGGAGQLTTEAGSRPRVFYVSYDGMGEPLGHSQVLAYLFRLSSTYAITLISFEKPGADLASLRAQLAAQAIEWVPLNYHRRPPVLSTMFDVLAGRRALIRATRRHGEPAIVHVRSYVPALIALTARRVTAGKLLFDMRGFWADERVEGGLWRAGGALYRVAKRCERWFLAEADAIITLTEASIPQIRAWTQGRAVPIEVIPTCVDPKRFANRPDRPGGPHAVWIGSIGTWYRFDLAATVARALSLPLTVITRQIDLARRVLAGCPAAVRSASPDEMPDELFAGDIGLCLIASSFSKMASAPTRFAEYLAAGMPVIVTPGVGDLESIVEDHGVGVVLRDEGDRSVARAAQQLREMALDRAVLERCRRVARERFDVDAGSERYRQIYQRLTSTAAT